MGSFLAGLGSFAGGLAQGIQQGQAMKLRKAENDRQEKEEARADKKASREDAEYQRGVDMRAAMAEAMQRGTTDAPHITGPGFDSEDAARSAVTGPPATGAAATAAPDKMSNQAAGLPTGAPQAQAPADPLAPLPDKAPAALPAPGGAQPMQLSQYQDPHTGKWHNVEASSMRPPNDTDRARAMYNVYMKFGEPEKAENFLSNYFQRRSMENGVNRQETSDALMRTVADPQAFANTVNERWMKANDMPFSVEAVMVPTKDGKSFPALRVNRKGSATPPTFLDANGMPTQNPVPGDYQRAAAAMISMAKGDGGVGLMTQMLQIDATLQNMALQSSREGRDAAAFPLEQRQRQVNIGQGIASTAATYNGIKNSNQSVANDTARVGMQRDELYGTGNVFGAGWQQTPGQVPGAPRDGGKRAHQGWDFSGMPVGTPVAMPKSGKVVAWKPNDGKAGNLLTVRYDDGTENTFMHLQAFHKGFKPGSTFQAGQAIAYAGNTGNASTAGTDRAVLHVQGSAGIPTAPVMGKNERVAAKDATDRLQKVMDTAASIAARNTSSPNGMPTTQEIQLAAMSLLGNESDAVKQAFRQQYASRSVPFPNRKQ